METIPRDVLTIILGLCSNGPPGSYGKLFRVCKKFKAILESLECAYWRQSLQLGFVGFKWVGLVNAAAFYQLQSSRHRHLQTRAPISPFVTRNPKKPTSFFRMIVTEALEGELRVVLARGDGKLCLFQRTRAALCRLGLHQEKALLSVTWHDSKLVYSAVTIGNGGILATGVRMDITSGTLGLDAPLSGPRLDRRRLDLAGCEIAATNFRVDLSYLLIDLLLERLNSCTNKHWYSTNPSRRFYPAEQRKRELELAGISDPSYLAEEAWLLTHDWPTASYKLLLAVLMPGQKITVVIHRHG